MPFNAIIRSASLAEPRSSPRLSPLLVNSIFFVTDSSLPSVCRIFDVALNVTWPVASLTAATSNRILAFAWACEASMDIRSPMVSFPKRPVRLTFSLVSIGSYTLVIAPTLAVATIAAPPVPPFATAPKLVRLVKSSIKSYPATENPVVNAFTPALNETNTLWDTP